MYEKGKMRMILLSRILSGTVLLLLIVSCASGKKSAGKKFSDSAREPGTFMADVHSSKRSAEGFFAAERQRKQEERRRFKDVSRPYHSREGSSRIYPWRDNRSRSEDLHDSIRSERSFIF
jgi:hypothetical protein